jgi:hypothetical protein
MRTNKQKALYGAVAAISAMLVSGLVTRCLARKNAHDMQDLNRVANELNKSLPMMVDAETQLTNVIGAPDNIIYNFKLVNLALEENPSLKDYLSQLKPGMIRKNCTTPETRKDFLDKGIVMSYVYYDKNSAHVGKIDIKPADCDDI